LRRGEVGGGLVLLAGMGIFDRNFGDFGEVGASVFLFEFSGFSSDFVRSIFGTFLSSLSTSLSTFFSSDLSTDFLTGFCDFFASVFFSDVFGIFSDFSAAFFAG
jgi:hypothetical protein